MRDAVLSLLFFSLARLQKTSALYSSQRKSRTHRSPTRAPAFPFVPSGTPFVLISNTADAIDRADFSFHFERALRSTLKSQRVASIERARADFFP